MSPGGIVAVDYGWYLLVDYGWDSDIQGGEDP